MLVRNAKNASEGELIVRGFCPQAVDYYDYGSENWKVYADPEDGGLWFSTDGGEEWYASPEDLERDFLARNDLVILDGCDTAFSAAVALMDDEIREQVHAELAPCCNQRFLDRYCELHEEKYGEEFTI